MKVNTDKGERGAIFLPMEVKRNFTLKVAQLKKLTNKEITQVDIIKSINSTPLKDLANLIK